MRATPFTPPTADMSEPEPWTLTVRLIRSFEHRNIRFLVLKVDPHCTVQQLMTSIDQNIKNAANLPPPFKKHCYDCMKINSYAHGAKTNDTAITLDHDEWVLNPTHTLLQANIRNETELSYYNKSDFERYKANPQLLW